MPCLGMYMILLYVSVIRKADEGPGDTDPLIGPIEFPSFPTKKKLIDYYRYIDN